MGAWEILTTLARAAQLAALVSLFGAQVFAAAVRPGPAAGRTGRVSLGCALVFWVVWFGASAAGIASADDLAGTIRAIPVVLSETSFGQASAVRLLLLLALIPLGRRPRLAIPLAGAALCVQPILGHAGAMEGAQRLTFLAIESLHLLSAGAWLGGLLPLLLAIRGAAEDQIAPLCARFTPVGLVATGMIAATALPQAATLAGGMPALIGTPYGHVILLKTALFLLALGLACLNRFVLAGRSRRWLMVSVAVEAVLGLIVIAAAASLGSLPPAIHVQPDWPFPWRPSLENWNEPELAGELNQLAAVAVTACGVVALALIRRQGRLISVAAVAAVLVWVGPSASLLFVEAFPTSYAVSPSGFSVESIARGDALFAAHCAGCHDARAGRGGADDLLAGHLWAHWDGELLWRLRRGATDARGNVRMPGFEATLPDDDLWALIDAVRARNIGDQVQHTGAWLPPVQAPGMPLVCARPDGTIEPGDRPPGLSLIVAGPGEAPLHDRDLTIVRLSRHSVFGPEPGECIAATPLAWDAWAVLAGVSPDRLAGSIAVMDAGGWLRAILPPDATPARIAAAAAEARTPVRDTEPVRHVH